MLRSISSFLGLYITKAVRSRRNAQLITSRVFTVGSLFGFASLMLFLCGFIACFINHLTTDITCNEKHVIQMV